MSKFKFVLALLLFFSLFAIPYTLYPIHAGVCELKDLSSMDLGQIDQMLENCQQAWDSVEEAKKPHEESLKKMEAQIEAFQKRLGQIDLELKVKLKEIREGEKSLTSKEEVLAARVRRLYIKSFSFDPLLIFLSQGRFSQFVKEMGYQQAVANEEKRIIVEIVLYIKDLEDKKEALENEEAALLSLKKEIDGRAESVKKLLAEATAYQAEIEQKISALTVRQQSILAARAGTFTTSVGDVPLADDPNSRPDFNPGFRPAFAAFSFGAYSHKKGLSQYGALGRAEEGKNAEEILAHYFPGSHLEKNYPVMERINVEGFGERSFEDEYMKRIYEIPNSWPKEVIKAQVITARTYAISRTGNGGSSICATQSCQVYKDENKGGTWEEAVNETKKWVLVDGSGNPVSGYYSSTTGGYLLTSGWDTNCGDFSCWTDGAYEKKAGSPWFYKGWYTESYRNDSAKCNRSHPWLSEEEFADILNAWVVRQKGNDETVQRVLPTTINSCSIAEVGSGNPFSIEEMRQKASELGGAYTSVSSVSVSYSQDGSTASLSFQTNQPRVTISGSEFKEAFNLRAPGYISIRSNLFNIEMK